jgi:hypothetical protein
VAPLAPERYKILFTALVENLAKKRLAATERPREGRAPSSGSRHIPAAVKRPTQLRCAAHNQYEAELDFGPRGMPVLREDVARYGIPWELGSNSVQTESLRSLAALVRACYLGFSAREGTLEMEQP